MNECAVEDDVQMNKLLKYHFFFMNRDQVGLASTFSLLSSSHA